MFCRKQKDILMNWKKYLKINMYTSFLYLNVIFSRNSDARHVAHMLRAFRHPHVSVN